MIQRRQLLTSLASLSLSPWAFAQADKGIVLGQSAPFSGPSEQLGVQYNQGARLYFEALNAKGGVNGRTIEIKRLDDAYDPEKCANNTRQFISEGVFALFGYVGTATSMAALPLATEAKVPLFAPLTGAQTLRDPVNRYVVNLRASYYDETAAIIKQSTSVGIKKFAVFYQNDSYGQTGLEGVVRALAPLNLKPVATGTVERNSNDVAAALKEILDKNPEAIVQVGSYRACATFIRLARRAGYSGNFYNLSFVGTQALSDELGTVARGVVVSQVMPYPYSSGTVIAAEYLGAMQAAGLVATGPNYSSMEGFVAAKVFTEAVRRAGKALTRESFITAVQTMQPYNVGGMAFDFNSQKNSGSTFVEMTLLTEDGKVRR
ncbi:ABC transporter substrate-binding protein [Rhodoferax aquaticus]|uniref:ABC transporter permease n=1 Tax=Rhodoferax aquaticus TaxID=2527691 RepID=A0A515EM26_9BURK|nr:ABC transporter substrate-binding protein [Rhodoferax aquaticus]QDL53713.1 ABC transporter permease [Rhodoferax aquaticus]